MIEDRQVLTGEITPTETLEGDIGGAIISAGGKVNDVLVNGESVVENKVANVVVPTELKDLDGDSTHRVVTDAEKAVWDNKSDFSGDYNDLVNKPQIPVKLSDLQNDEGFITSTVSNLANYYLKSETYGKNETYSKDETYAKSETYAKNETYSKDEVYSKNDTYTKSEVNTLIGNIEKLTIEVVEALPQTGESNVLYLVPKEGSTNDVYDEYLYINNDWEHIGSTEVDLSNYYTKTETNTLLGEKQDTLVSGTNIKTINNTSLLGSGNIDIQGGGSVDIDGSSITTNSDDEIQTVGVIDSNSGNTNKMWTGTLQEYNAIQNKDPDTYYYITDDETTNMYRPHVEVITSSDTSYTIDTLTANKAYKLGELTALTVTACEMFDEETVIYFSSGSTATVLSLPNDVVQIGDTTIAANKSYIIAILNKIAAIKEY